MLIELMYNSAPITPQGRGDKSFFFRMTLLRKNMLIRLTELKIHKNKHIAQEWISFHHIYNMPG